MFRHFVPSRELHSLATLVRLSLVDLPSANSIKCCSPPARFINCINIYQSNGEQERVIYMKKMFILVMAVMLCFTLTACNEEENIDFPFELSSIENVEMFRFTNPADAEKKAITKSEDIEEIYQTFESVSLKDKTTEPTAGGSVTSFRFNLSEISLDKHREPPPEDPARVFALFPAEEAEGEEGAACFAIFRHE